MARAAWVLPWLGRVAPKVLLAAAVGLLPAAAAPAGARCAAPESCRATLQLDGSWRLPYYSNYPLTGSPDVTRALVVVHGANRKPEDAFVSVLRAADAAGAVEQTLVVAPYFQTAADDPGSRDARWSHRGWIQGDDALAPAGLSSFAVLDDLLRTLADKRRFPRLAEIVVAGHSAGGQFIQRYAAGGRAPSELTGTRVDFVIANPSSYLYFTPDRPTPTGGFAVPTVPCAYDDYKYGLRALNPYLSALRPEEITQRYLSRHVTYLLGTADTGTHQLDRTCPAMTQGATRFQRGQYYGAYLRQFFPGAADTWITVPGIGHTTRGMFTSPQARPALFPPLSR